MDNLPYDNVGRAPLCEEINAAPMMMRSLAISGETAVQLQADPRSGLTAVAPLSQWCIEL